MTKQCTIDGCGRVHEARGWCKKHYNRWWRHGDPLKTLIPMTAYGEPATFLAKAISHHGDDCLKWPYSTARGYGRIKIYGRQRYAHRLICEAVHGAPPTPEYECAHNCGRGHEGCVNPSHLRWATSKENHADKLIHDTHQRGERHGRAKLTEADVHTIRRQLGTGQTQRSVAKDFGVHKRTISDILSGATWSWLTEQGSP